MSEYLEGSVPLVDVAKACKMTLAELVLEADRANVHQGVTWDGQRSVTEVDAQRLVSGEAARTANYDRAKAAHASAEQDWTMMRSSVYQRAYTEAFNRLGGPRGGRASEEAAREAADAAVAKFERDSPAPTWDGLTPPSWMTRAKSKLTDVLG